MGLFSKNKKQTLSDADTRDPHIGRYGKEFYCIHSLAAYGATHLFSPDMEGTELIELLLIDEIKDSDWAKQYAKEVIMKIYDFEDGQLSFLKFPEPKSSPEVLYAASVLPTKLALEMKDEEDLYYRPYYILTKIVDMWFIGQIEPRRDISNEYYTTYHKRMEEPDPIKFIEWILDRENLGKVENIAKSDPISDYLLNRVKRVNAG